MGDNGNSGGCEDGWAWGFRLDERYGESYNAEKSKCENGERGTTGKSPSPVVY